MLLAAPFLLCGAIGFGAPETAISANGKALLPVIVGEKASPRVRAAAGTLAEYLKRITGATFEVREGDGRAGIAVGTWADFPALPFAGEFAPADPFRREEYVLRSHEGGIHLVGAADQAVENAVWDLLYRFGYRQFFPTATWEVTPSRLELRVAVDTREAPSFPCRAVGYDYGFWDYNRATLDTWSARNRAASELRIPCNHAYQAIIAANKAVFQTHPEYLALSNGERVGSKMCLSNPEVRKIIVDYALRQFEKDPAVYGISMEPSDGEGWCECAACAALGSPSDRAAAVANMVADAVTAKFGPRFVGMLAYSTHASPPAVPVRPNVLVQATTHQIAGGLTHDAILDGWRRQGAVVGVSEAYCTYLWDASMPAAQRGSDIAYIRRTIPHFREKGAVSIGGWTADSWGAVGLGNYLVSRMTWDVREAQRVDALVDDFLDKCFGAARPPMERFFRLIYRMNDTDARPLLSDDLVGRMYRSLDDALGLAADAGARARVCDLILYTRYVELYRDYKSAATTSPRALAPREGGDPQKALESDAARVSPRQRAYEELMRLTYRIRRTEMVHAKAVWCSVFETDKSVSPPAGMTWGTPEGKHPWKSGEPVTDAEVRAILAGGIARNKLCDVTPVAFSGALVPAARLKLPPVKDGVASASRMRPQMIYAWVDKAPAGIALSVTGGIDWQNRGNVKLSLYALRSLDDPEPELVAADEGTPPDKAAHDVALKTPRAGLHRLEVHTGGARAEVVFKDALPHVVESGADGQRAFHPTGSWSLYFYVPKTTSSVAGYADTTKGEILDAAGKVVLSFAALKEPGYFNVPVGKGQSGTLWKFEGCSGQRLLMTVPPYLARNTTELLLPREVVDADAP